MRIRTYSELRRIPTFEERFDYLQLRGQVGASTFGFERWANQGFYRSREWRDIRHEIIIRDNGQDLAFEDHEIFDRVIIHHMNPMTMDDVEDGNPDILNPEFLITVSHRTHNAIHYGDRSQLAKPFVERRPGDTQLWAKTRR